MAYYLDYSAAKLFGPAIKLAGYTGVIRYIDAPDRLRTKHTNKQEYESHIAYGLDVRLVMQNLTTDADGGFPVGRSNAQRALAGAEYLDYEDQIFFTNDRTTLPNPKLWIDYLTGAASVLGWDRVGAYGFANAMDVAINMTPCRAFWQAGRKSDADKRPYLNFWQDNNQQVHVVGVLCDRNLVLKPLHKVIEGVSDMGGELIDKEVSFVHERTGDPNNQFGFTKNKRLADILLDTRIAAELTKNSVDQLNASVESAVKTAVVEYLATNPLTVSVDYAALAKAVNDDAARRMES